MSKKEKNYNYPKEEKNEKDTNKKNINKKKKKQKKANQNTKQKKVIINKGKINESNEEAETKNQETDNIINNKDNNKIPEKKQKDKIEIEQNENIEDNLLNEYIEEIKKSIDEDKNDDLNMTNEMLAKNLEEKLEKKAKKNISIEVEQLNEIKVEYENNTNSPIEVKDKIFNDIENVYKEITYAGKPFIEERHKSKDYPKTIIYRCKNQRKNERQLHCYFCNAVIKRKIEKDKCYYILEKDHTEECNNFITKKIEVPKIINNYNDYISKCFNYLNSTENYNKSEFTLKLQNIYNENNYNFSLKENTIKNIIGRWKQISLKFTKYNALEHRYNKNNELILWDYVNTVIYTSNKKNEVPSEYFIWSSNQMIARARISNHLFVDGTFHHPIKFAQLLIILFKDAIISQYIPCFYILMSNKTEILYDLVFKSIIRILTQNNAYHINYQTITTDTEIPMINAINNNFENTTRIGCWFHLKQNLLNQAKICGLLNKKNSSIDTNLTFDVISQLCILPLTYKGNIEYLKDQVNLIISQYPECYNNLCSYFLETKLKYFEDGSYDYNKFPKDIRSNSVLERYNRTIKNYLGEKRTCNWVVFLNFINNEILRINEVLGKNENVNILFAEKNTKFGMEKFTNEIRIKNDINENNNKNNNTIANKWLINKFNNCRYNAFITLFYFTISPFINDLISDNMADIKELNDLIIKLSKEVSDKNYNDIIIFLQKNNYDVNNKLIDQIVRENDEDKKANLINKLKFDTGIDFTSSGYAAQLFSIFRNNNYFCFLEEKTSECIICGKKTDIIIKDQQPFIFINNTNINEKNLFNILLQKYKEKYTYDCECRRDKKEDVLCTKVKYNIVEYPKFMFLLFDMQFDELKIYKKDIFNITEAKITLNLKVEYNLVGIISAPKANHFNSIIFNPLGKSIDSYFKSNFIYYHDGEKNNGKVTSLGKNEDWKNLGIPYIVLYKMSEV